MAEYIDAPEANAELKSKFRIEIDGIQFLSFQTCSLSALIWGSSNHRVGNDDLTQNESSGLLQRRMITLKKLLKEGGKEALLVLWRWAEQGSKDKRSGAIVQVNRTGDEVMRWDFEDGWIKQISDIEWDATDEEGFLEFEVQISVRKATPA